MPPTEPKHFTRSSNACDACRRRKVKCSGSQPCRTCTKQGLQCEFGGPGRRGYSTTYVQQLLSRISEQEEQLKGATTDSSSTSLNTSLGQAHGTEAIATDIDTAEDGGSSILLKPEMASGPAFESRVKSIIREHPTRTPMTGSSISGSELSESFSIPLPSTLQLDDVGVLTLLLPEAEAHRLFDVFVSLLGINQHYLDPRTFADSMDLLYQNETYRMTQMKRVWFIQYLLVMAMGMLISCPRKDQQDAPGNAHFCEAMRLLPPIHELASYGVIGVEILLLVGLYLQWCDRKQDAYLYIGSAVRLAVTLGCALARNEQEGVSSEKCHRNRVWWTAYMLDRRLSAALGLPLGADERQISADLPRSAAGFPAPLALIINVQIARFTGDIMTTFYGNASISQADLVNKIQRMLHDLNEVGGRIPSNFVNDFEKQSGAVDRTNASLFLMLFQAIILCIRPIVLQCVKEKVQAVKEDRDPAAVSPVIQHLCSSCQEAARKSICVLSRLKRDKTIALFGYFDLDATFSAAFILAMMGFVESTQDDTPPEGVRQAAEVLIYLSKAGNMAAERRLGDLKQFCQHVWSPDNLSSQWTWLKQQEHGTSSTSLTPASTKSIGRNTTAPTFLQTDTSQGVWPLAAAQGDDLFDFNHLDAFQTDLIDEMGDIYSSFNDPSMPLTGDDSVDWAEMGKVFDLNGS